MVNLVRNRKRVFSLHRPPDGSAFREWESFQDSYCMDVDRKGFEKWKCMSVEERGRFVIETVYQRMLFREFLVQRTAGNLNIWRKFADIITVLMILW
ncbi:hypothetical protein MKW98_020620 [Papaver atlanticum]|uniref:Uncharacterized protein n=1 Tax=Papaver atlanticum TaxID=357466 RepID=A0AAD4TI14_9MAGN|nr:hypothetical protein MKW98_020620 [Papaver atlanticum]